MIRRHFNPREWQVRAFNLWKENRFHGIFSIVTGGGKSIFGMMCIQEVFEKKISQRALIVVPTLSLQDQWQVNLSDFFQIGMEEIGIWKSKSQNIQRINICVINTLSKIKIDNPGQYILIADECHRYASDSFFFGINKVWRATVGLSATTKREYDNYLEERLIPVLGTVLYEYSYIDALHDEVINNYDLVNVECPLSASELEDYRKLTSTIARLWAKGQEDKAKLLSIKRSRISNESESRILGGLACLKNIKSGPTIVFFETVNFAKRFSRILTKLSIGHALYHSGQSNSIRQQNLFAFKEGYFQYLLACRALDEGLDIPSIENAIIISSTSTERQRIQRVGRVLRKKSGKDRSKIFSLYSVESEYDRLFDESIELPSSVSVTWQKFS